MLIELLSLSLIELTSGHVVNEITNANHVTWVVFAANTLVNRFMSNIKLIVVTSLESIQLELFLSKQNQEIENKGTLIQTINIFLILDSLVIVAAA